MLWRGFDIISRSLCRKSGLFFGQLPPINVNQMCILKQSITLKSA